MSFISKDNREPRIGIETRVPLIYNIIYNLHREREGRPTEQEGRMWTLIDRQTGRINQIIDNTSYVHRTTQHIVFRIIDGILSIADTNRDGQLTYAEFKNHLSSGAKSLSPAEEQRNQALQLLSFIDANGDNKLDQLELYTFSQKTSTNKVSLWYF